MNVDHPIKSEAFLDGALNELVKRKVIPNSVILVNNPIQAEKTEPGYLVKLATEIENVHLSEFQSIANNFVFHSACNKLKIIQDQIDMLKKQALQILVETKINSILHSLPCNFSKRVGHVYSVYQRPDGKYYFSMISPKEWGSNCPHKFIGSFRLKNNMSWDPVDENSLSSALRCWVDNQDCEDSNLTLEYIGL